MTLERVTFVVGDSSRCQPCIQTVDGNGSQQSRPFEIGDFERVLDFDISPPSPPDTPLRLGESDTYFPVRYFCLRGCFLFYFKEDDIAETEEDGVSYAGKPLGVIPLDRTQIEFPEGGRRVFQKHANSNASKGYEFAIIHTPKKDSNEIKRRDEYIVVDSSTQREEWKLALSTRSGGILKDTILRPGGGPAARSSLRSSPITLPTRNLRSSDDRRSLLVSSKTGTMNFTSQRGKSRIQLLNPFDDPTSSGGEGVSNQAAGQNQKNQQQPPQQDTLSILESDIFQKFTDHRFNSDSYTDQFFIDHPYQEADASCREMESTLLAVKRGLRGAVLEQYKYFVQASQEMKIMGKEVAALQRTCADQLVTLVDGMKDINFAEAFADDRVLDEEEAYYSEEGEDEMDDDDDAEVEHDVMSLNHLSDASYHSSDEEQIPSGRSKMRRNDAHNSIQKGNRRKFIRGAIDYSKDNDGHGSGGYPLSPSSSTVASQVEIPPWLSDVTEEISAFKKECRYTEATHLSIKAKRELIEIFTMHEKASRHQQLTKKQQTTLRRILMEIESLMKSLGDRLVETLRRKNEAMKQTYKRERQDPFYELMPLVSPVCLEDDASALQLLVKLGRPHDAAVAYSVRRSMLLSECLNERPIANSGSVTTDVVIYACQLSQGYFSALSQAVEGFLNLFSGPSSGNSQSMDKETDDGSSVVMISQKRVPARAMANIVLWCDQELGKFASTFGGPRLLGRLSLTSATDSATTTSGEDPTGSANAGTTSKQPFSSLDKNPKVAENNRQTALVAAAKAVDHVFTSASNHLDSIGLPILSRLAESIRTRLKGCESEIVILLPERWQHVVFSWSPHEKRFAQNLLRSLDNKVGAKAAADVDSFASTGLSKRSSRRL